MGENSKIAWCDNTFNPWIGCEKVSAGCQNCYAEALAKRYGWVNEWGKDYRLTSDANWKKPIQWAKQAVKDGVTKRVFCASLADVFDKNISQDWRDNLFDLILDTEEIGGLEWLLLTKRPENISSMINGNENISNIRIGVTIENQEMAEKRLPIFFDAWGGKNFISVEPMLSKIDLRDPLNGYPQQVDYNELNQTARPIEWVICGCESGTSARDCDIEWVRDLQYQCSKSHTPFFLKQLVIDGKFTVEPELDGRKWLEFP